VTDPRTWGTLDEALLAYNSGKYSGVGFVFTTNDEAIKSPGEVFFLGRISHRIDIFQSEGVSHEGQGATHGKRTSSAVKTKELCEVGKGPAGPFALDFHGVFAGIAP